VGFYNTPGKTHSLIEHWDGHHWKQTPSPSPAETNELTSVAATSSTNAWATGFTFNGHRSSSLILHWNGHSWKRVSSPNPGVTASLNSIAAMNSTSAWAVGGFLNSAGGVDRTFTLRWNGHTWRRVLSPNAGGSASGNVLEGVTITSARNAWAVGFRGTTGGDQTLVLRWNGTKWRVVSSPDPGQANDLFGVVASGPGNAWAVGRNVAQALILHGCVG
jgi:hypothetical protein